MTSGNNICPSDKEEDGYILTDHQIQVLDKLSIYKRTIRSGWLSRCALIGVKDHTIECLVERGYIESAVVVGIWTVRYTGKIYWDRYEDTF